MRKYFTHLQAPFSEFRHEKRNKFAYLFLFLRMLYYAFGNKQ